MFRNENDHTFYLSMGPFKYTQACFGGFPNPPVTCVSNVYVLLVLLLTTQYATISLKLSLKCFLIIFTHSLLKCLPLLNKLQILQSVQL